jgi:nicotinate phosphoribosyltransferase
VSAPGSPALLTDRYELTMVDALEREGALERPSVFEVFARRLPAGRRYGVLVGTGRLVELLAELRFGPDELAWLRSEGIVSEGTAEWLAALPAALDVDALGACMLAETLVLSVLNFDSAVAAAASRMTLAVGGHRYPEAPVLIEMGSRRTNELAAPAAARAAVVAGFASSSNLEAGRRYGVPTAGTVAHAFVLAHADEREAFAAQVRAQGPGTTVLVDTYDIPSAIRLAVEVAGPELGAVRIDSGDLAFEARRARSLLDELGAKGTRIVVSGDLDERAIARLERGAGERAPVDAYGVGTRLVAGSGAPSAELVYKLVALGGSDGAMRPVAKRSAEKTWPGGAKQVWRALDERGEIASEVVRPADAGPPEALPPGAFFPALVPLLRHGRPVGERVAPLELAKVHRAALCTLPEVGTVLDDGSPAIAPTMECG